jgi:hypothetical protein
LLSCAEVVEDGRKRQLMPVQHRPTTGGQNVVGAFSGKRIVLFQHVFGGQ